MAIWDRLMAGVKAGWTALSTYNEDALTPLSELQWDGYAYRAFRYQHLKLYYFNAIFSSLEQYRGKHLETSMRGLHRDTRSVYNPIGRLVDSYPSKVYGGKIDMDTLTSGAIPVTGADDTLRDALIQLYRWSNMGSMKTTYVLQGAMLGDSPIKVIDERHKERVRLELLDPGIFKDVTFDAVGNVTACVIEYVDTDDQGRTFTYKEIITKESFATFKDNIPFAYVQNTTGEFVSEWPNEFGFVPVAWAKHRSTGYDFGMSAGQKILPKVDELSSIASRIHDNVNKVVNPMFKTTGIKEEADITFPGERDEVPIIYLPENATMEAIISELDIPGAMQVLQEQLLEVERDTPELALHRIRSQGNITAPGVKAGFSDAIALYIEAMGNYDTTLVNANMMALTMGGHRNYRNFESFGLGDYDAGNLEHGIQERNVIEDGITEHERITFMIQQNAPESIIWRELGISEDDIEEAQKEEQAQNRSVAATIAEALQNTDGDEQESDQEPTEEIAELAVEAGPEG